MKLNITDLSYDSKEYEYKGAKLWIRPYPFSMSDTVIRADALVITGEKQFEVFDYCLPKWDNVVGSDGKPIPCNTEVKKKIYDFRVDPDMIQFVVEKSGAFKRRKEEEEKN